ncbi:MAG TPA: MgtC/SapB family protein [Anaerolineaceae bacterium]|nr:MgtC/SapB family protein [Anaerolineaceae bacterium]
MIPDLDIIVRLLEAALLGGLVGFERERAGQPAGLRTHIILTIGAALAMCLSINLAMQFRPEVPNGDPARLAAQVVSGIGFLGAGAILRYGTSIKGLTTATSLWTLAIVGMAVGAGYYGVGAAVTALLLIVLYGLNWIEHRFIQPATLFSILLLVEDRPGLVEEVRKIFSTVGRKVISIGVEKNLRHQRVKLEITVSARGAHPLHGLMTDLAGIPGLRAYKIK